MAVVEQLDELVEQREGAEHSRMQLGIVQQQDEAGSSCYWPVEQIWLQPVVAKSTVFQVAAEALRQQLDDCSGERSMVLVVGRIGECAEQVDGAERSQSQVVVLRVQ